MADALGSAISGLKVAQRSLDVISGNISNASTVGYTRKILPQESIIINGEVAGTLSGTVYRNVDRSLIKAEQYQVSISNYHHTKAYYLDRIMQFHGSSDSLKAISTKISAIETSFVDLASYPNSTEALGSVISDAQSTVDEFNNFSKLLSDLREQTESDLESAVEVINIALDQIEKLNGEITKLASSGSSIAAMEDQRDAALKTISEYLDVNSYFEDKKLVVITKQGTTLVDSFAHPLSFASSTMIPAKSYPNDLSGLYIEGENVTDQDLGGKIAALFELRDQILPQYEAQLDELAQKLSYRLAGAGLQLFNDQYGNVPNNTAPPALTGYVGYAGVIEINEAILDDPSLLRNGTTGNIEHEGSIEVIKRVIDFAFGKYSMETAQGDVDLSGVTSITTDLGITTHTRITGTTSLTTYPDFSTLPNAADLLPAGADFDITLEGPITNTITVTQADTVSTLVTKINTAFGATIASINSEGALAFDYDGDITLASQAGGPSTQGLTAAVINDLGHSFGTTTKPTPKFTVQLGSRAKETIEILPTDDPSDLVVKLNAINGLTAYLDPNNFLVLIPEEGGALTLLNEEGQVIEALGLTINKVEHEAFRTEQIGPDPTLNLSSGLLSKSTIQEYANAIVSNQAEATRLSENRAEQEQTYLETIEQRNANISGVNIDEEMADLIRIQANYSASAQLVSNIIKMFDTLLNAFS